jgi:hypothetical protein
MTRKRENSRWTLCRRAMGREPKAWEFMLWIQERWAEFGREHGIKPRQGETFGGAAFLILGEKEAQQLFDRWLRREIKS